MTRLFSALAIALSSPAAFGQAGQKVDLFGDPLPKGAAARLGTLRWTDCKNAAYSPDGKTLAVAGEKGVVLWDTATQKVVGRLEYSSGVDGSGLFYSPNGRYLAVVGFGGGDIDIWDMANKTKSYSGEGAHSGWDFSACGTFTGDGRRFVSATSTGIVRVDVPGAKNRFEIKLPFKDRTARITAISPDAKLVATHNLDERSVIVWDVDTGKQRYKVPSSSVDVIRFSPDSKSLAIAGDVPFESTFRETIRLIRTTDGTSIADLLAPGRVHGLDFSKDSKTLYSAQNAQLMSSAGSGGQSIGVWDLAAPAKPRAILPAPGIRTVYLSPDGRTIAWRCCFQSMRFHSLDTAKEIQAVESHRGPINAVRYSPDGTRIATASDDNSVRTWDARSAKPLHTLKDHTSTLAGIAFAPDGRTLASGGKAGVIKTWDIATGRAVRTSEHVGNAILAVEYGGSGSFVLTGGNGPSVQWNPRTGAQLAEFDIYARDVKVLNDGLSWVAIRGSERQVVYFDGQGKRQHEVEVPQRPVTLAASSDGRTLVVGCETQSQVLTTPAGHSLMTLPGLQNDRGTVVISPDDRYVASVGDGYGANRQTIQIFELATGKEIRKFDRTKPMLACAFSPDGRFLATGGEDTTATIWDLYNLEDQTLPATLSAEALERYWAALADPDPAKAYAARVALIHAPESAVAYLAKRLTPAIGIDPKALAQWIADLDDPAFRKREAAERKLTAEVERAEAALRAALAKGPALEVRNRIEKVLAAHRPIPRAIPEEFRAARCVEILERIGSPGARGVLERLAKGDADVYLTREAVKALRRLDVRARATP